MLYYNWKSAPLSYDYKTKELTIDDNIVIDLNKKLLDSLFTFEKLKNSGYNPTSKKEQALLNKLDKINLQVRKTPIELKKPKNLRIKGSSYSLREKERDVFGNKHEWFESHKKNNKKTLK